MRSERSGCRMCILACLVLSVTSLKLDQKEESRHTSHQGALFDILTLYGADALPFLMIVSYSDDSLSLSVTCISSLHRQIRSHRQMESQRFPSSQTATGTYSV